MVEVAGIEFDQPNSASHCISWEVYGAQQIRAAVLVSIVLDRSRLFLMGPCRNLAELTAQGDLCVAKRANLLINSRSFLRCSTIQRATPRQKKIVQEIRRFE